MNISEDPHFTFVSHSAFYMLGYVHTIVSAIKIKIILHLMIITFNPLNVLSNGKYKSFSSEVINLNKNRKMSNAIILCLHFSALLLGAPAGQLTSHDGSN